MRKVLGNVWLFFDEFLILFIEVEFMFNLRLFIYEYNEIEEVLMFFYLLYGRRIKVLLDEIVELDDVIREENCFFRFKYFSIRL